jgi:hypothetical protein
MFMVYKNLNDFLPSSNTENNNNNDDSKRQIINSNIISFKMNDKEDLNYLQSEPIHLTFKHLSQDYDFDQFKPICSFWNYNKE